MIDQFRDYIRRDDVPVEIKMRQVIDKIGVGHPLFLDLAGEVKTLAEQQGRTDNGVFSELQKAIARKEEIAKRKTPP